MKKRRFIPMVCMLLSIALLAACSGTKESSTQATQQAKKELTFLFNFASQTVDPSLDYTPLRAGVVETLVKLDKNVKIQPWLATQWSSKDGQNWEFQIRDGVTFQNGKKLTAETVKQSLERSIELNPGVKQVLRIKSMKASGQTLRVVTEESFPQFPSELVHPNTAILDTEAADPDKKPIGTGPFQVESFTAGTSLKLARYDGYWNGAAKLDRAVFAFNEDANARLSAILSGDADIVYRPPVESMDKMKQDSQLRLDSVVSLRTHELIFNTKKPLLQNEKVRKAFDALVNREELKDAIMGGQATVAQGPFLPDFPFVPKYPTRKTGTEEALKWFKEAGLQVDNGKVTQNGRPLTLKLVTYASRAEFPIFSQALQSEAKQLGITLQIEQVENYEDYLMNDMTWDLGMYSPLIAPRGDASYFLNVSFLPDGTLNYGKINDELLNKWIYQLDQTVDTAKRNELIAQALTRINDQTYYSYMVHPNTLVVYKDSVKNWVTSKSEYYMLTNQLDVEAR